MGFSTEDSPASFGRRQSIALLGTAMAAAGLPAEASASSQRPREGTDKVAEIANRLIGHGYFLMVAQWELHPGNVERAKAIIDAYRPFILKADGIKIFLAAQDRDDPNHILFYEAYESEAHYKAHAAGEAFQKWIVQEGLPLVAKRTLNSFTLL